MSPGVNVFSFLQSRRCGGARPGYWDAKLTLLCLEPRWTAPDFLPLGSTTVKSIAVLGSDAFCMVQKGGRADLFAAKPGQHGAGAQGAAAGSGSVRWLVQLTVFDNERMVLVAHLPNSRSLLTVFTVRGRGRRLRVGDSASLFVRILDVPAALCGEVQTRNCGELAEVRVPDGGFVEFDAQNDCIWVNDLQTLRCWDAGTFQQRFVLGPWGPADTPNLRLTPNFAGLLTLLETGVIDVELRSAKDGGLRRRCELQLPELPGSDIVLLELMNEHVLLKRQGCEVAVVDLSGEASDLIIPNTQNWEPEVLILVPPQGLILAFRGSALEVWQCAHGLPLRRLGGLSPLAEPCPHRFRVVDRSSLALLAEALGEAADGPTHAGKPGDNLVLRDLLDCNRSYATISGACSGKGGVAHMVLDMPRGMLMLVGRRGGASMLTVGGAHVALT